MSFEALSLQLRELSCSLSSTSTFQLIAMRL